MKTVTFPPKQFWQDHDWAHQHYFDLAKRYEDMWVAIWKGKVIVASPKLGEVEKKARRLTGTNEFSTLYVTGSHRIF